MKTKQVLLSKSPAGDSCARADEGIAVPGEHGRSASLRRKILKVAILAASCFLVGMSDADKKKEIESRFNAVNSIYKKCESRYNDLSKQKDKEAAWLDFEVLRAEWRTERDYCAFSFRAESNLIDAAQKKEADLTDPKVSAEDKAKSKKWLADNAAKIKRAKEICDPYLPKLAKMEESMETWTGNLRPSTMSSGKSKSSSKKKSR